MSSQSKPKRNEETESFTNEWQEESSETLSQDGLLWRMKSSNFTMLIKNNNTNFANIILSLQI